MPYQQTERLLDVHEVAEWLNVNKDTVYRWSRLGYLPSIRMPGGVVRWAPSHIEKFKNQRSLGKL